MNPKILAVAAMAVILIVALAVTFSIIFGNGNPNFKISVSRTSPSGNRVEVFTASHKDGSVKLMFQSKNNNNATTSSKLYQFKDDIVYEYVPNNSPTNPWILYACQGIKKSSLGVSSISDPTVKAGLNGEYVVSVKSDGVDTTLFSIKVKSDGKTPESISLGPDNTFTVDTYESDKEVVFPATFPTDTSVCTGNILLPTRRRELYSTTTYKCSNPISGCSVPNEDTKLMKVLFGSNSWSIVNNGFVKNTAYDQAGWTQVGGINQPYTYGSMSGSFSAVFLKNTDGWCAVSISGTNDVADVVVDLAIGKSDCDLGSVKCHSGFYYYYNVLLKTFVVSNYNANGCTKIQFMGHSLGGATAHIAAALAPRDLGVTKDNIRVFTAAAPRAFTGAVALTTAKSNTVRLVDESDPIPTVPPSLLGFSHPASIVRSCDWHWDSWWYGTYYYSCNYDQVDNWSSGFAIDVLEHPAPAYMTYFTASEGGAGWGYNY